jgi:hypothetical protein
MYLSGDYNQPLLGGSREVLIDEWMSIVYRTPITNFYSSSFPFPSHKDVGTPA